jgi:hypothetical protein
VGVLDADADGWDDIVTANRDADNLNLLTNDGTGKFFVSEFDATGLGESAIAIADANHDGVPDIFLGFYDSGRIAILLGDGQGGFSESASVAVPGKPWMIAASDLNGDGNADVCSANSDGSNAVVLFGDGQGGLSAPVNYPHPNGAFPLAIDLGDLDGDGDLDMITSNYSANTYRVYANDGVGLFTLALNLPASLHASCAIVHDHDNDGDLDLTGTDEGDDVLLFFENPSVTSVPNPLVQSARFFAESNPFGKNAVIRFELEAAEMLTFKAFDAAGQFLFEKKSGGEKSGVVKFDAAGLAAGVYFFKIFGEDGRRFEVLRLVRE